MTKGGRERAQNFLPLNAKEVGALRGRPSGKTPITKKKGPEEQDTRLSRTIKRSEGLFWNKRNKMEPTTRPAHFYGLAVTTHEEIRLNGKIVGK